MDTPPPHSATAIPDDGWRSANRAFEADDESDELFRALTEAAPHIRLDELDELITALSGLFTEQPLFGRKNAGIREGIDLARQLLLRRRDIVAAIAK